MVAPQLCRPWPADTWPVAIYPSDNNAAGQLLTSRWVITRARSIPSYVASRTSVSQHGGWIGSFAMEVDDSIAFLHGGESLIPKSSDHEQAHD